MKVTRAKARFVTSDEWRQFQVSYQIPRNMLLASVFATRLTRYRAKVTTPTDPFLISPDQRPTNPVSVPLTYRPAPYHEGGVDRWL